MDWERRITPGQRGPNLEDRRSESGPEPGLDYESMSILGALLASLFLDKDERQVAQHDLRYTHGDKFDEPEGMFQSPTWWDYSPEEMSQYFRELAKEDY
jgi:hypothetical protein